MLQGGLPTCQGTRYKSRMMEPSPNLPVGYADIAEAARVLAPFSVRTPLLSSPALDERVGSRVFLKPEMLQRRAAKCRDVPLPDSCPAAKKYGHSITSSAKM